MFYANRYKIGSLVAIMKMLIKDKSGAPSFTETSTVITFVLLLITMVMVLLSKLTPGYILWFLLPFGLCMAFRYQKKIKLGKDGIDISQDTKVID